MKRKTMEKLKMYKTVHAVLTQESALWNNVPKVAVRVGEMAQLLNEIDLELINQKMLSESNASEKNVTRKELENMLIEAQKALYLLGNDTSNYTLKNRYNMTATEIKRFADLRLIVWSETLIADLTANSVMLDSDYAINLTDQQLVNTMLDVFKDAITAYRESRLALSASTRQIEALELKIDKLLKVELDALLFSFKRSNPEFYAKYVQARHVIKFGGFKKSINEREDGETEAGTA